MDDEPGGSTAPLLPRRASTSSTDPKRAPNDPPYNTKLGRAGRPGEAPWLLFSIINRSQGEREKSIISSDFLPNRRDPIQDPTGSAVVRYHELCFSLGFGAFFATGS